VVKKYISQGANSKNHEAESIFAVSLVKRAGETLWFSSGVATHTGKEVKVPTKIFCCAVKYPNYVGGAD
jgi:hypothetical protein